MRKERRWMVSKTVSRGTEAGRHAGILPAGAPQGRSRGPGRWIALGVVVVVAAGAVAAWRAGEVSPAAPARTGQQGAPPARNAAAPPGPCGVPAGTPPPGGPETQAADTASGGGRPGGGAGGGGPAWDAVGGAGGVRAAGTAGQPGDREPGRFGGRARAGGDLGPAHRDDPAGRLPAVAGQGW